MIVFSDVQRVAPKVLERLNALASLPAHGVVAGQAVATVMWEELNLPMKGPLNDIDVFVSKNLPPEQREVVYTAHSKSKPQRRTSRFAHWKETFVGRRKSVNGPDHSDDYKMLRVIAQRGTLSILRTYRRGLLNYTLMDAPEMGDTGFLPLQVAQALVNGFDLNCVAVGIDLNTQRAVCTPEFLEFLNTPVLKPQRYRTPSYTLIRLAKKIFVDQMEGVACDFEREKDILLSANDLQQTLWKYFTDGAMMHTFGPNYLQRITPLAAHLPPVHNVREPTDELPGLWTFESQPQSLNHKKTQEILASLSKADYRNIDFARSVLFSTHFADLWDAPPTVRSKILDELKTEQSDHINLINLLRAPPPFSTPTLTGASPEQTQFALRDSGLTNEEQLEAVQLHNTLPSSQLELFNRLSGELNEIKMFCSTPEMFYKRKFLQFGLRIFNKIGSTHPDVLDRVYTLVKESAKTTEGRALVRRSWEHHWETSALPSGVLEKDYAEEFTRIALGADLDVAESDRLKMVYNIVATGLRQNSPLPTKYPSFHASHLLRRITAWRFIQNPNPPPHYLQTLSVLIDCCCDEDFAKMRVIDVITGDVRDLLTNRFLKMNDESLEKCKNFNFSEVDRIYVGVKHEQKWHEARVFFENLSLTRVVGETNKNKSPRRM